MSEDTTYNGWTNKPTWLVNLWMDNDECSQGIMHEMAERLASKHERDDAIYEFAKELEVLIKESMPEIGGMYMDLMSYACAIVDYRSIAIHWVDEAIEEAKEEEE